MTIESLLVVAVAADRMSAEAISSLTAPGALFLLAAVVGRMMWNRLERHERRVEKRLDAQEEEIKNLRDRHEETRIKYDRLVGATAAARECPVEGCPHRKALATPPLGSRIPSDPANPPITPRIPRK